MMNDWQTELLEQAAYRMNENTPRIAACLAELHEEEVWLRPNAASNSMGNLVLHLCGNIRQYAISGLGGQPDVRTRDEEFAAQGGPTKAELLAALTATVHEALVIIQNSDEQNLLARRWVQGYELSGIGIIMHVVEHYSYHTGQIAFWTKLLKNKDLGFYAGVDLNVKNQR
ncbi:hypothetical protein GCM10027275_52080 [Rhabdobacter roseus]|uniref:Putative damage-inducible protein DinB n=1 Tax=Rhabdobacter roseus TaxID=1655419 RepID=A0A840U057_9BACT|nr:DinB family protein [Rhabdobacter roseus]MBB5287282.1 putative damage-inducible protein DinB [Rhabdobacter roseus]